MPNEVSRVPRLLRVREVSEITSLERFRIYEAIRSGDLPALRIGRTYRVPEHKLIEWIERRSAEADR